MVLTGLGLILAVIVGSAVWARAIEPRWFRLRRVRVTLRKPLPGSFTILHLSDLHFHKENPPQARFFEKLARLSPDFICLTGDIIDSPEGVPMAGALLSKLKARFGAFAVLGNHDYFDYGRSEAFWLHVLFPRRPAVAIDPQILIDTLEGIGYKVLRNGTAAAEAGPVRVTFFGLDDPVTRHHDVGRALSSSSPEGVRILLTHLLDPIREVPEGAVDLALAGHTHGGQLRLPLLGPLVTDSKLPKRYARGVRSYKGVVTIVSQGLGQSHHLPIRFSCPPEALWIEVKGS